MKRAYKLQEFVAHSAPVNCLKIGRKTSRVLVTGGDDYKVNMWAIGKPNAILIACSLAGHSSPVESVTFDGAESHVVAGAANGAIKLWDLEEAKIVRTLAGHRSNCLTVDFHPFGEFFASGSSDSNLKIWDIRRKGCIHTYKGHTKAVNCLKFSPDGRWVVSGGEDNSVKLWDLTAGKLIHDFKCHNDQILSLDFHPHEFLLATGSGDRTTKFYDLETFEVIGSSGSEDSGIRSMVFTPDGRTLLCGMEENLKVYSWEPIRCHDLIEANWSRMADLNVHEGKLLGCSFKQSCVGVWVVDLSRVSPFRSSSSPTKDSKSNVTTVKTPSPTRELNTTTPRKNGNSVRISTPDTRHDSKGERVQNGFDEHPNRTPIKLPTPRESRRNILDKEMEATVTSGNDESREGESRRDKNRLFAIDGEFLLRSSLSADVDTPKNTTSHDASTTGYRASPSIQWERKEREREMCEPEVSPRRSAKSFFVEFDPVASKRSRSLYQDDIRVINEILQERTNITNTMQSRLAKLQVVRRFWMKNDLKSAVETMAKMEDKSVLVDGLSVLIERGDVFTLEVALMLLPLLNGLLSSETRRHVMIAIGFTSMLVRNFGQVITETVSSSPTAGVDLQAETRFERCDACFKELQLFKQSLRSLLRKSGELGKAAQALNYVLDKMKV